MFFKTILLSKKVKLKRLYQMVIRAGGKYIRSGMVSQAQKTPTNEAFFGLTKSGQLITKDAWKRAWSFQTYLLPPYHQTLSLGLRQR